MRQLRWLWDVARCALDEDAARSRDGHVLESQRRGGVVAGCVGRPSLAPATVLPSTRYAVTFAREFVDLRADLDLVPTPVQDVAPLLCIKDQVPRGAECNEQESDTGSEEGGCSDDQVWDEEDVMEVAAHLGVSVQQILDFVADQCDGNPIDIVYDAVVFGRGCARLEDVCCIASLAGAEVEMAIKGVNMWVGYGAIEERSDKYVVVHECGGKDKG